MKWMWVGLLVLLTLTGCSTVRVFIDPQPVVEFKPDQYLDPTQIVKGEILMYVPEYKEITDDLRMRQLLAQAPIIVHGLQPQGQESYDRTDDQIGRPFARLEDGQEPHVLVDVTRPTVFFRFETAVVQGRELTQLVYNYWYQRHPIGGIQKGHLDGGSLRITLDAAGRPAVYEHAGNCGCYHGIFVGEHVEAWARQRYDRVDEGKTWHVEKKVKGRINWKVRDIVFGTHQGLRPVIFIDPGAHTCAAIQSIAVTANWGDLPKMAYKMEPYEALGQLPVEGRPGETVSMFRSDGLVWGGRRTGEEIVFFDMNNPGWPRHLDKVQMHWDEVNWPDPTLLETYLRLPAEVLQKEAVAHPLNPVGAALQSSLRRP